MIDQLKLIIPSSVLIAFFGIVASGIVGYNLYDHVFQYASWSKVGWYVIIGLLYSVLEFIFTVYRERAFHAAVFNQRKQRLNKLVEHAVIERLSNSEGQSPNTDHFILRELDYIVSHCDESNTIVALRLSKKELKIEPYVNYQRLVQFIAVWTVFWPMAVVLSLLQVMVFPIALRIYHASHGWLGRTLNKLYQDTFSFWK